MRIMLFLTGKKSSIDKSRDSNRVPQKKKRGRKTEPKLSGNYFCSELSWKCLR